MALVGTDGHFLQVNRSLCEIVGYLERELLDKTFQDITHPDDLEADLECVRQLLSGEIRTYQMEKRYSHKKGHVVWILLNVSLVRDEESAPLYFISQMQDVTKRKQAEEEIKKLSRQNELILNSAGQGIFGLDLRERTEFVNPAAAEMLGYEVEELMGGYIHDIIHHSHPDGAPYPKEECPIYAALREGAVHRRTDEVFWRKDGSSFPVEYVSTPIREDGEVIGAVAAFSDITERKQAEEEIQRLNETLEERVAERTAQLIERGRKLKDLVGKLVAAQEEERRRVAYEIHDGLTQVAIAAHQRLQAYADDHPPVSTDGQVDMARALELVRRTVMEGRRVIENLRPTALDEFGLASALRLQVEELEKEGWEISYQETLGEECLSPEVETALYRVAQEALTNVRKHARTKRARVALTHQPGRVRLEVRDEGRGFDPRATLGSNGPGERVGLSGMRERVELLGGELSITSEPGRGTSVVAEVPLPQPEGRNTKHGW